MVSTCVRRTILAAILAGAATGAFAGTVAPSDVKFDHGAVDQSLTGVPGDPAKGAEAVGSKKIGNCVACHKVSALPDIPWQGEIGPVLDGAGGRWTTAELRGIVTNAKHTFDGTVMPSFYRTDGFIRPGDAYTGKAAKTIEPILTAQQVEDVVAFLSTLKE